MTATQHAEWLSLLEISGPFLSLPVLTRIFPQGIDAFESQRARLLRDAYEEWADNVQGLVPDPLVHGEWVRFVLEAALGYDDEVLKSGTEIPESFSVAVLEHGETLKPDLLLVDPQQATGAERSVPRLVIQILPPGQDLEKPISGSRWKASAATRMMELLHALQEQQPDATLGLLTNGERWMLISASKGETTGFTSWYASLWFDERLTLRAFAALLGAQRFFGVPADESLSALLVESAKDQHEVTDTLGYQVRHAVEILVQAIDRADRDAQGRLLAGLGMDALYEAALTVMMRLVFLLSAEERKLLPLDDPFYAENYAIYPLREILRKQADETGEEVLERNSDAWFRLLAVFRAVYAGVQHDRLRLPAYGGSLFDPDRFPFLEGREPKSDWRGDAALPIKIPNRTVLHLLDALQVLGMKLPGGGREARRISFRALDIEQIGHVYEGLLDHQAVRADEPVLGLVGAQGQEPEVGLSVLENFAAQGADLAANVKLIEFLREITKRSESALRNSLSQAADELDGNTLRIACGNDAALIQRVLPFAGLLREDDFGTPVVVVAGSVYVTAGNTRRATGTHYTPRSLTEPIVQHTLEPLVYTGPAEGKPKEDWQLKRPEALLDLKICDMAMGSGAFLVQVVRYLSERLVEAWEQYPVDSGQVSGGSSGQSPNTDELITDDRLLDAKRLVADRCIYGVDKNPLAVEMAKLSLWLITLDRAKPFSFLDHALKCGDSLVGASESDFLNWARGLLNDPARAASKTLFDATLEEEIALARQKRRELQSFQVLDLRDAERKALLLAEADAALERVKLGADLLTGSKLLGLSQKESEDFSSRLLLDYVAGEAMQKPDAEKALNAAHKERAFHWGFEFPEVFQQGGFSAFVGNPPFIGGRRIIRTFGEKYQSALKELFIDVSANADFSVYFFLQAYKNTFRGGYWGLIATKTIAEGDTRESGLQKMLSQNTHIYRAISSQPWPGAANVLVAIVFMTTASWKALSNLNNEYVKNISSFLLLSCLSAKWNFGSHVIVHN
ncbi:MAG: restriction endonuclease, partial [Chloroflexi bacterium]|nr:restriction endonuclease [Chloroflexota bacterium]